MSRINCHSAFKHYEMFHSGHCGGGYSNTSNTIFNINCGGHGGFWNGFGLGLGNALGGLFGGFGLGGFGFGGFGGGMGFGFPSFGGFGNLGGNWGNWGNWGNRSSEKTTETLETREVVKEDPDCAKIADITGKIKNLGDEPTKETVSGIIDDIDEAIEDLDNNNKRPQKRTLENLKQQMIEKLNKITSEETTSKDDEEETSPVGVNPDKDVTSDEEVTSGDEQGNKPVTGKKDQVAINGTPINISEITVDTLRGIKNPSELDKITKEQAIEILTKLGYITGKDDNAVGHLSNIYGVLLLLEKSGVTVEVEHRRASDDQWIKGPISNVQQAADGKLSYNVDCANIGAYGAKYTFQAQDTENTKYKVSSSDTSVKVDNTIEVEYQCEQKPLLNKSDKALAKKA